MLDGGACLQEEPQPIVDREMPRVGVFSDRHAADVLHHEERFTLCRWPRHRIRRAMLRCSSAAQDLASRRNGRHGPGSEDRAEKLMATRCSCARRRASLHIPCPCRRGQRAHQSIVRDDGTDALGALFRWAEIEAGIVEIECVGAKGGEKAKHLARCSGSSPAASRATIASHSSPSGDRRRDRRGRALLQRDCAPRSLALLSRS